MKLLRILAFAPLLVAAKRLKLYHRLYHPALPDVPFSQRGTVSLTDGQVSFTSTSPDDFAMDLIRFSEILDTDATLTNEALYQIALEREGDDAQGHWDISPVKVCHLHQITSEHIILHTKDSKNEKPFALDYFVSPIPHDGACPKIRRSKKKPVESPLHALAWKTAHLNTTITLSPARFPPLPELRTPPPLTPEGAPVVPEPEKSFLQKYWMYILAVLVALFISGGGEEEEPKRRTQ